MSIICLICKDKLLNNAPGSPLGSLNSLIENQVIATGCGHLYHAECLQCWFRTQKKKLQNQGVTGDFPDHCPACQTEVDDEQIRHIHLLEDHREALEKAKFLERMENLEIYCHQLEVSIQQLHRENDLLLNKALSPIKSPLGKDEFAAIVKNDRVMWLKKDSPPLSGIVLSIFKKDASLWVKIKLDKKIRTNQRSGILGSFRFDKKQEWTVPFEDIVLEKDFKKNNIIDEDRATSEPTTPTLFLPLQKVPSFRSSTLSLPGDYAGQNFYGMHPGRTNGLQPILSYDFINNYGSNMELFARGAADRMGSNDQSPNVANVGGSLSNVAAMDTSSPTIKSNNVASSPVDEQREYVVFNPKAMIPQSPSSNKGNNEGRISPQDGKGKHVTFADDLTKTPAPPPNNPRSSKGNHFRDHDYKNVTETPIQGNIYNEIMENDEEFSTEPVKITVDHVPTNELSAVDAPPPPPPIRPERPSEVPAIHLIQPSTTSTPCSSSLSIPGDMQTDVFIDSLEPKDHETNFNSSCFDMTFTALFYGCDVFDKILLLRNASNDQIQQSVQQILAKGFVDPLRNSEIQQYKMGYSDHLYETIAHLCSSYLDLEELMTILFEYVFKIPPFISYSYDMCDYIHQFFIDFTDKAKMPTVQQLFEQSLALQDNLKLRGEPNPALFLQMPNSEDGIIHYEAVLPSVTLNVESFLEAGEDAIKAEPLTCYCNKIATLECAVCAQLHGKSPVLFCEDCSILLEAIHDQMYHKLELSPVNAIRMPAITLELAAVICLKSERYSVFLRNTTSGSNTNNWMFIEEFEDGKPKVETASEIMDEWVESAISKVSSININDLTRLQRRLLTECRMFLYLPVHNSFA